MKKIGNITDVPQWDIVRHRPSERKLKDGTVKQGVRKKLKVRMRAPDADTAIRIYLSRHPLDNFEKADGVWFSAEEV